MCQIQFKILTENNDKTLEKAEGRYKLASSTNWMVFSVDLNNLQTPDITIEGDYELQVRVTYESKPEEKNWSDWQQSTFSISEYCGYGSTSEAEVIGQL